MLSGAVARAGHWVEGATGLCSSLSQQAEAALQLEYSRRGSLWAPGEQQVLGMLEALRSGIPLLQADYSIQGVVLG
jgi:hypothetical protein